MSETPFKPLSFLNLRNLGNLNANPDEYVDEVCISSYITSTIIFGFTEIIFPVSLIIKGFSNFVNFSKVNPSFSLKPVPTFPIRANSFLFLHANSKLLNQSERFPSPHAAPTITKSKDSIIGFNFNQPFTYLPGVY